MKLYEIKQLDMKKLFAALRKTRRDLAVIRFQVRTGVSKDTARIKFLRKAVAKILTLMSFKNKAKEI
jgi:ribosomal protein L29